MPDGESGIACCLKKRPALVIVDMMMPDMNGIEVLKIIKTEIPESKVILCTAAGSEVMVALAMRHRADGYIVKPYDREKLLMSVQRSLGIR